MLLATLAACAHFAGCAARAVYHPKLSLESLSADLSAPQTAGTVVRWKAVATGGIGDLIYEFGYRVDGEEQVGQEGPSASWDWTPAAAGRYEVTVTVRDAAGYVARSAWSPPYEIAPALVLASFSPSVDPPRRAHAEDVFWTVEATGGIGERTYEFRLDDGKRETLEQAGPSPYWMWSPGRRGQYRVRATVRDAGGNEVDSGWSSPFGIKPGLSRRAPIAVLPVENLSGRQVPLEAIRASLVEAFSSRGQAVLDQAALDGFMARHRMRFVGGISSERGRALEEETGATAVLVCSIEQYMDLDPPRITLHPRLVSTGEKATILWSDGIALAGHESPGLLDLGRIRSIDELRERAIARVAESVLDRVAAEEKPATHQARHRRRPPARPGRRFRPEGLFRSADAASGAPGELRVAVLPFENTSGRPYAGRLMELHFVRQLASWPEIEVVEPGQVRQILLKSRLILDEGPSLSQTDLLRAQLNVDLLVTGTVTDYEDPPSEWATPVVGFTVQGIEPERRRVDWASISHGSGKDGVFFFEQGAVRTAHRLAARMVAEIVTRAMRERRGDPGSADGPIGGSGGVR